MSHYPRWRKALDRCERALNRGHERAARKALLAAIEAAVEVDGRLRKRYRSKDNGRPQKLRND